MPYGPNDGTVPFTGFTPTLGAGSAASVATAGTVHADMLTKQDRAVSYLMRRPGSRKQRELLLTLLGATAGSAAAETRKRIAGGEALTTVGDMTVQTIDVVNRNTTADDVTALTAMLSRAPWPSSYVNDASGNGGGGRLA